MTPAGRVLRFATYNVHSCIGVDGRYDPARTAGVIDELDADLVALQEFTYPLDIALETRTPVVLESLTNYQCALGPTRETTRHRFGNVVLTRHPIVEVHRIDLSMERREPRGALAATIEIDGVRWHVLAAHLGLKLQERQFQVKQILQYLADVRDTPLVVLGDFNDWLPGRSVVHALDDHLGRPPRVRSFPVSRPLLALDRIWVHPHAALRSVKLHRSRVARLASDHFPVVAEVMNDPAAAGLPAA